MYIKDKLKKIIILSLQLWILIKVKKNRGASYGLKIVVKI